MKKNAHRINPLRLNQFLKVLLMFKFICILVLASSLQAFSKGYGQTRINVNFQNMPLKKALKEIEKKSDYRFLYNDDMLLKNDMPASLNTKDASLGSVKGKDIPSAIGSMIRSSIKNNSRNIIYRSTSISIDGEFIIEVGIAEAKDDQGNQKWISKYLVVYKQENGAWKLYRDIGL